MEYTARIICETEKAYKLEAVNFEYPEDLFVPKKFVDNWMVPEWFMQKFKQIDGGLQLLIPDGGIKAIEKVGEWSEDPNGNNGGAKVTNANLESSPAGDENVIDAEIAAEFDDDDVIDREIGVEIGDEDAGTREVDDEIDDLTDIDGDGEPEPGKEEEKKDTFGEQAKKEIEKIKQEQGLASTPTEPEEPEEEKEAEDTGSTIPPEVEELIEENAVLLEHTMRRGRKVVDNVFTDNELNNAEKAEMAQDIGISLSINVKRGY